MSEPIKVYEARTQFSAILSRVEAGEEIVIARGNTPIARLCPISKPTERPLGMMSLTVPEAFFEPLDADELAAWDGDEVDESGSDSALTATQAQSNAALAAAALMMSDRQWS